MGARSSRWVSLRKLPLLVATFSLLVPSSAESLEFEEPTALSGIVGTLTVDGAQWQRLDLRPRFKSGGFEAVLDLELFLDDEGRFRDRGWDFSTRRRGAESLLRKIHYVRYKHPSNHVAFRIGALDNVTLGQGLTMYRYRNTLDSPGSKLTGVDLKINDIYGRVSLHFMANSLIDLNGRGPLVGGHIGYRPARKLEVGFTAVMDTDQLRPLPDSVRAAFDHDSFGMLAGDVTYPLMESEWATLRLYGEVARTHSGIETGTAVGGPGVWAKVGGLTARAEYRWVEGRITPGHFDGLYERNRVRLDGSGLPVTKESILQDTGLRGVYGDLSLEMRPFLTAGASYQHLNGSDEEDRRLEGRAALSRELLQLMPKIGLVEAYYENRRRGPSGLDFFDPSTETRFGYRVGFRPFPGVTVLWDVQFTYVLDAQGELWRQRLFNLQTLISL